MPILRTSGAVVTPPVTGIPVVKFQDQPVPLGIVYVDPDGNSWILSDLDMPNGYICTALTGLSGTPMSFTSVPLATGGALAQLYIPQTRQLIMGLLVMSLNDVAGQTDYLNLLDELTFAFTSLRNEQPAPGTLIISRPDGTARQCTVYMTSGIDQPDDDTTKSGQLFTSYALTLQAVDPYWYDLTAQDFLFAAAAGGSTGILPLLPLSFTGTTNLGDVVITNFGTAEAYPVWTITGPGTPVINNLTTGRSFTFSTALTSGQKVIVNTQPGQQSVIDVATEDNLWDILTISTPRDLFPLIKGDNDLSVAMTSGGTGTKIEMSMTQRWLRA